MVGARRAPLGTPPCVAAGPGPKATTFLLRELARAQGTRLAEEVFLPGPSDKAVRLMVIRRSSLICFAVDTKSMSSTSTPCWQLKLFCRSFRLSHCPQPIPAHRSRSQLMGHASLQFSLRPRPAHGRDAWHCLRRCFRPGCLLTSTRHWPQKRKGLLACFSAARAGRCRYGTLVNGCEKGSAWTTALQVLHEMETSWTRASAKEQRLASELLSR